MLEIKITETEINIFDELISRLDMAEERIFELHDILIETSKTEQQNKENKYWKTNKKMKKNTNRTSKNCDTDEKAVTCT